MDSSEIKLIFNDVLESFIYGEKQNGKPLFNTVFNNKGSKLFEFDYNLRLKIIDQYNSRYNDPSSQKYMWSRNYTADEEKSKAHNH